MSFGVYIHIPYCIQRCRYCDFTTFEQTKILPPNEYVEYVKKEIRLRSMLAPQAPLTSVYFGGGTPSLIDSKLITDLLTELKANSFIIDENTEVTLEINPATVDEKKLQTYLAHGINRFSVGAQTFNDELLKACGREHNSSGTHETLSLLKSYNVNYTADLLFALPRQNLNQVEEDVHTLLEYEPNHISAYCLTVPTGHPMNQGRAPENEQLLMFDKIHDLLFRAGLIQYEISNFARPGLESKHNMLYWSDQPFVGFGLSAHSYLPKHQDMNYGIRFWNPKKFEDYFQRVEQGDGPLPKDSSLYESLKIHESLTDYCHMFLRTQRGLNMDAAQHKFPATFASLSTRITQLINEGLLVESEGLVRLSPEGFKISNKVFESLTFFADELAP